MSSPPPSAPVPGPRPGPADGPPIGVAQALARLDTLAQVPVAEHVEAFDSVHRMLQDALATIDEA